MNEAVYKQRMAADMAVKAFAGSLIAIALQLEVAFTVLAGLTVAGIVAAHFLPELIGENDE